MFYMQKGDMELPIMEHGKFRSCYIRKNYIRGASKIKVKNVNKKRMATARRQIFLEFLKASIADLITLFFS
jgi:hypothetical protein